MLIKVIFSFLAIQLVSFAVWQGVHSSGDSGSKPQNPIVVTNEKYIKHEAAKTATDPFPELRFVARTAEKKFTAIDSEKKQEIAAVLQKLPAQHFSTLKNIVLDYDSKAHRGLGGKNLIILRAVDMDSEEFFGVMIHEIGHNVDLGYLSETDKKNKSEFMDSKTPVYEGDLSLDFYRISWNNDKTRKKDASNLDFVSGYALTDPFEDFAESYVYYILHNKDFKSKSQTSAALLQKYEFMKNKVFGGMEFDTGEYLTDSLNVRPWDITVLSYDLNGFLAA